MDSLKFILGAIVLILCMGAIGILIWIMLFGIPQGNMDGGTLVYAVWNYIGKMAELQMQKGGVFL